MYKSKLFTLSRRRLALWYAGVMGVILSIGGLTSYHLITQSRWHALHRELESVAGTLHDGLEPVLPQPGQMDEQAVNQVLPNVCLANTRCVLPPEITQRHSLSLFQQKGYYIRFLDLSGRLIATVGQQPEGLPFQGKELWQTLQDRQRNRFHQISLILHTANHDQNWGYMQLGRSLKEFDEDLTTIAWLMGLSLPISMLLISGASWWLAGLAMRPVYQSYQQIQQFTADAAHELRTPLASSKAMIESTLELDKLPEMEARDTLNKLDRQTDRLIQLVQDLLLLSRMNLQVLSLKHQPCCLNDLMMDLMDEFDAFAIAAGMTLTPDLQVEQSVYVSGDEEQLYRLMANLITNAIQYTPKGGWIILRLMAEETYALLQVEDTGIGIAATEQIHIFDRFYRVHSDRSRHTGGAGLGLAIAQAIAQTHQGELTVQSKPGQGSTFTLHLPLKSA
jgi:signal transduction histidine kinase